jgi:hypothetical protein
MNLRVENQVLKNYRQIGTDERFEGQLLESLVGDTKRWRAESGFEGMPRLGHGTLC